MKKTGLLILLVVLTLCMVAFAACGNTTDPKQNDDPSGEQVHTHTFGELIAEVAATCEADGTKAHKHCSGCNKDFDADGKELTDLVIPKLGHDLKEVAEAPATCGAEGTKAHKKCATCGKLFDAEGKEVTAESLKIEKLTEHTIVAVAKVDETCAKEGVKAHKECTVCGKLFDTAGNETTAEALAIAKDEHDLGDLVAEVPAGYGVDGVAAHYQCSVCKAYFDKDKKEIAEADLVIPALKASEGLEFTSNGDGTCVLTGIGTCTDTDVVIPSKSPAGDTVIEIGEFAFNACTSLKSVTIPKDVSLIGDCAFALCNSLEKLTIAEGNEDYYSDANCIIEKGSKRLVAGCAGSVIPSDGSVTQIGDYAFMYCEALESIVIPACIQKISSYAFADCDELEINFVGNADAWGNVDKSLYWDKDTDCTIQYVGSQGLKFIPNGKDTCAVELGSCEDQILVIPAVSPEGDTVTEITELAFLNHTGMTTIVIPKTVTKIGKNPFKGCTNLATVKFSGCSGEWWDVVIATAGAEWKSGTKIVDVTFAPHYLLIHHPAQAATATEDGNIEYWQCEACGKYFSDAAGTTEIKNIVAHKLTHHAAVAATTTAAGNIEYWYCEACGKYFSDAKGTIEISEGETVIPQLK